MNQSKIYVCLPILNESENLPQLLYDLVNQSYKKIELIACVNQPDEWWNSEEKISQCIDNLKSIEILNKSSSFPTTIIDVSTKSKGWKGKQKGVGWARKIAMDKAASLGSDNDLIVSIDADTEYPFEYLNSIVEIFAKNPKASGLSNPYYHQLTDNEDINRSILRYEIYMRNYAINMLLIDNPYHFTALGSAMSTTIKTYKRVGGLSPKSSGEDFYFLQKLQKFGNLIHWNQIKVFPEARFSSRVNFGTGPAMIKGNSGDWSSYPIYHFSLFQKVKETYDLFSRLFEQEIETPMSEFLQYQLKNKNIWQALRNNYKTKLQFVKACETQVDGLRILQFLKQNCEAADEFQSNNLIENLIFFGNHKSDYSLELKQLTENIDLNNLISLQKIREVLMNFEYYLRKNSSKQ